MDVHDINLEMVQLGFFYFYLYNCVISFCIDMMLIYRELCILYKYMSLLDLKN